MTRILLIDDDEKLGELLKAYFQRFDMQLDNAVRPSEGLMKIQRDKPDLVILDANPLDDIRHTRSLELIMHHGIMCQPQALLERVPSE